jgi:hypothetical protein
VLKKSKVPTMGAPFSEKDQLGIVKPLGVWTSTGAITGFVGNVHVKVLLPLVYE